MENISKIFKDIENLIDKESHNHNDIKMILEKLDNIVKEDYEKKTEFHKKYLKFDSGIVKFNIGGQPFSTHELNITKRIKNPNNEEYYGPNLLEGLISGIGNIKLDENKAIFIDRNPEYFNYILDYLRSKQNENADNKFELKNDKRFLQRLLKEAKYYQVEGLVEQVESLLKKDDK